MATTNTIQFWQQHNQPQYPSTMPYDMESTMNYIHENSEKAGFVNSAEDYPYSSAVDFVGGKGFVNISPY